MNRCQIIAWMNDMQMSAHLAKLSTIHSYDLQFIDTINEIIEAKEDAVLIVDLNSMSVNDLKKMSDLKMDNNLTFLGFCEELNGALINYFKEMGCDIVFKRYEFMKNMGSILNKIFNAS